MKISPITTSQTYSSNNYRIAQNRSLHLDKPDCDAINFSFKGLNLPGVVKQRGMLFHITNLPAHRSFCGQFGDIETHNFIKWLKEAKQTHWIMNPLNALEDNLCPYSADGRFSRNKFIVNLNKLTTKEYGNILKKRELPDDITPNDFTFDMLEKQKNPRFKLAYERFQKLPDETPIKQEYKEFIDKNDKLWTDGYANFSAVSKIYGTDWTSWNKELQTAPEDAIQEGVELKDKIFSILRKSDPNISQKEIDNSVGQYKFEQFLYDKQFNKMVEELNDNGIKLIMDLPIGVSATGIDTWYKKNLFLLDENFKPLKVSGCPSEKAYPYTQVWGHALYNYDSPEFWDYQEESLKQLLKSADLRLDHFVGYINRAEIPTTYTTSEGKILHGQEIFKPKEEGGMGADFFMPDWIEDIYSKKSPKGENMFELLMRMAREAGKKPEDCYILEDFGPLAKTKLYKKFKKKYGNDFISQELPIHNLQNTKQKCEVKISKPNVAILTGNHDLPPIKEFLDKFMDPKAPKKTQKAFKEFCEKELKLTPEEMNDKDAIFENIMKWYYTRDVKQVQTTLQDALGIYFRPNIPGFWNGMNDKFLMKTTPEALLSYWSKVFPKDFLLRDNKSGINPGYKTLADRFVEMMKGLFSEK